MIGSRLSSMGAKLLALGKPDSALAAFQRAGRFFPWGSELQYEWEQLPLLVAEAALGVNDTALRRARELLDRLDRKIPPGGRRYPAAPSRTRSEPK